MSACAGGQSISGLARRKMNDLNHSNKGGGAIDNRRRPFEHFNSFDVREVEIGDGGVECAAQRNAIDYK